MATLSDVAARAGVSISAVSRVLSADPRARVSAATRERIRQAATELGYVPNFAGRALRLARTELLALVVPGITNSIGYELIRGVEDEASSNGYSVLLGRTEDIQPGNHMVDRLLGEGRVDGAILQPIGDLPSDRLLSVFGFGVPVVTLYREFEGITSVFGADALATELAVRHLAELGHERIGLIGGPTLSHTAGRREQGFRDGLLRAGLEVHEEWITRDGYLDDDGVRGLAHLLGQRMPPTAVVAANVHSAIGVLTGARQSGISVPSDLSVVSVHDAWAAEITGPPLTCVRMPLYEIGRTAVRSLLAQIDGGQAGERLVVEDPAPVLVPRASAARP